MTSKPMNGDAGLPPGERVMTSQEILARFEIAREIMNGADPLASLAKIVAFTKATGDIPRRMFAARIDALANEVFGGEKKPSIIMARQ